MITEIILGRDSLNCIQLSKWSTTAVLIGRDEVLASMLRAIVSLGFAWIMYVQLWYLNIFRKKYLQLYFRMNFSNSYKTWKIVIESILDTFILVSRFVISKSIISTHFDTGTLKQVNFTSKKFCYPTFKQLFL